MGKVVSKLVEKNGSEHLKTPVKNFFELQTRDIKGVPFSFNTLREKRVIMIVNVASE